MIARILHKRESNIQPAGYRLGILAASGSDYDKLAAIHRIRGRSRISREWQGEFPEQLARCLIEGAQFLVEVCRSDKNKAARSDDRSAVVFGTGVLQSLGRKFRILSQGNLPHIFACV